MGRKNYAPGSNEADRKLIPFNQNTFSAGVIKDFAASQIPDTAIAEGKNVVVHQREIQGRLGSTLFTPTELPPLTGKTGLVATKDGYIITCTSNIFTEDDVGNYWVWPGTETTHEEIIHYINGTHIEVSTSSTRALTTGCYMRGKVNLWKFHSVQRVWLFLLGNEFWIADQELSAFTLVPTISVGYEPYNAVSQAEEFDNQSWVVFNSAGHFHITFYQNIWVAWKRNIPIPSFYIYESSLVGEYAYGYIYSAARLTEMGNFVNRLTPSRIELETGTNIWGDDLKDWSDINRSSALSSDDGEVIGPLYVPRILDTDPEEYQRHLTHFPVYRTCDKVNKYQSGQYDAVLNNPQQFIWVYDLRICAAFFARKYNGHILARYGEFEQADVGSVVEWEDGNRDTIIEYIAPDDVVIDHVMYYDTDTDYMACAIGNGRVLRASQSGTTVTRTHGDVFTAADVNKTITWSTGYRSYIRTFVDANTVTVYDEQDRVSQGITIDPVYRNFYDTTDDDTLKSRVRELTCRARFLQPMPEVNDGVVVPGFLITCRRGEKDVYYCAWEANHEYLSSFYNVAYQLSTAIKDPIQKLLKHPNRFTALCQNNKTWFGPINLSDTLSLPEVNVIVPILSGIDVLDAAVGCFDFGSVQEIDNGMYVMLTAEPSGVGLRRFNGTSFSANELEIPKSGYTTVQNDLEKLQKATGSVYDAIAGYIVWGREKE
jgi:hypothetical protein